MTLAVGTDHHFALESYENGILKESCPCGEVRFCPADGLKGFDERVKQLNRLFAEEGTGEHARKEAEGMAEAPDNSSDKPSDKPAEMKIAEAHPSEEGLKPPVPPRPKGRRGDFTANKLVTQYYEDNKAAIPADLAELGLAGMLKRWNIPRSTWYQKKGLAERWGLQIERRQAGDSSTGRFERDKEAIIHDYQSMPLVDFLKKGHMSSLTWRKLKERWQVQGKMPRKSNERPNTKPVETQVAVGEAPGFGVPEDEAE